MQAIGCHLPGGYAPHFPNDFPIPAARAGQLGGENGGMVVEGINALPATVALAKKHGVESGVDKVFEGFQIVQFFVCLALVIVYLLMMKFLGFFVATIVFMIAALLYLGVPKVHTAIAVVAINLLVYFAFVQFLGVKLPAGLLF